MRSNDRQRTQPKRKRSKHDEPEVRANFQDRPSSESGQSKILCSLSCLVSNLASPFPFRTVQVFRSRQVFLAEFIHSPLCCGELAVDGRTFVFSPSLSSSSSTVLLFGHLSPRVYRSWDSAVHHGRDASKCVVLQSRLSVFLGLESELL